MNDKNNTTNGGFNEIIDELTNILVSLRAETKPIEGHEHSLHQNKWFSALENVSKLKELNQNGHVENDSHSLTLTVGFLEHQKTIFKGDSITISLKDKKFRIHGVHDQLTLNKISRSAHDMIQIFPIASNSIYLK